MLRIRIVALFEYEKDAEMKTQLYVTTSCRRFWYPKRDLQQKAAPATDTKSAVCNRGTPTSGEYLALIRQRRLGDTPDRGQDAR